MRFEVNIKFLKPKTTLDIKIDTKYLEYIQLLTRTH